MRQDGAFFTVVLVLVLGLVFCAGDSYSRENRFAVPRVAYGEPKDQSTVDLTGKENLTFTWSQVPIPSGGREAFRFKLYKGFSYDRIISQDLGSRTFSIDVPSDKFVNAQTYTWRVEQRDGRSMIWSLYDTWSFKVIKK